MPEAGFVKSDQCPRATARTVGGLLPAAGGRGRLSAADLYGLPGVQSERLPGNRGGAPRFR